MKLMSFDLETSKIVPDGDTADWGEHWPLGISCAGVSFLRNSNVVTELFYSGDLPAPAPQMSRERALDVLHYLAHAVKDGYTIVTWNGFAFDFRVLAHEAGSHRLAAAVALSSVDLMLEIVCRRGHPLALDAAAKGAGLDGKTPGMNSAMAPALWAAGEYQTVLDYLRQDCKLTLRLAYYALNQNRLKWISKTGKMQSVPIHMLPAVDALKLPEPNNGWMKNPIRRANLYAWISLPAAPDAAPDADVEFSEAPL